jgi:hypothetical protein
MFHSLLKAPASLALAVILLHAHSAIAAVLAGDDLEIGWTGNAPFGPYVVNGAGTARGIYAIPASGYSGAFSTSPYASSSNTSTTVSDTNIRITNTAFGGWVPAQWFQYLDYDNTLPDFRNWTFTLDSANTTVPGFNLASRFQVQESAFAIEFGEIAPGQVISINVAAPEPGTLATFALASLMTLRRRRR